MLIILTASIREEGDRRMSADVCVLDSLVKINLALLHLPLMSGETRNRRHLCKDAMSYHTKLSWNSVLQTR
ncbi:hypothetical protein ILYODFUR_018727 [Ilyodon furcidens]|uniref:Uncharacterized protein n=1 Tax=Ilyodon furcidens TaxID=33524 RepID=A0ABV0TC61_9TELE